MELATEKKMEETFQLADRVNRINVSPTMVVLQEAEKLKAQGIDVADFGPANPIFRRRSTSSAQSYKLLKKIAPSTLPSRASLRCARRFAIGMPPISNRLTSRPSAS